MRQQENRSRRNRPEDRRGNVDGRDQAGVVGRQSGLHTLAFCDGYGRLFVRSQRRPCLNQSKTATPTRKLFNTSCRPKFGRAEGVSRRPDFFRCRPALAGSVQWWCSGNAVTCSLVQVVAAWTSPYSSRMKVHWLVVNDTGFAPIPGKPPTSTITRVPDPTP